MHSDDRGSGCPASVFTDAVVWRAGSTGCARNKLSYRPIVAERFFVTTSAFSAQARETAELLSKRIVLIDGDQLARLMIRHDVGCRVEEVLTIKKIDEELFE